MDKVALDPLETTFSEFNLIKYSTLLQYLQFTLYTIVQLHKPFCTKLSPTLALHNKTTTGSTHIRCCLSFIYTASQPQSMASVSLVWLTLHLPRLLLWYLSLTKLPYIFHPNHSDFSFELSRACCVIVCRIWLFLTSVAFGRAFGVFDNSQLTNSAW